MVRLATIEDAEAIAAIHVCGWQIAYEGIVPTQFLASLSTQERANMWRIVISEHHGIVLLAASPHGEVGFISFGPSRVEDGREKAEIYAIYVLPQFWHQGIGRELLDEAERRLEGQLSNLKLSTLPEAIGRLCQLRRLDLSGNQLSTLPKAIGRLSQLQGLYLSANQLCVLPSKKRTRNSRFLGALSKESGDSVPRTPWDFSLWACSGRDRPWAGGLPVGGRTCRLQGCIGARGASPQSSILRCSIDSLG